MQVKCVVLDKTGTLTIRRPVVVGAKLFTSISLQKLCDVATAIEVTLDYSQTPAIYVL